HQPVERIGVATLVGVPEPYRIASREVRTVAVDADRAFDGFQPAREIESATGIHEVEMRSVDIEVEARFEKRNVESLAIERDQQAGVVDRGRDCRAREVLAANQRGCLVAPMETNRGDLTVA